MTKLFTENLQNNSDEMSQHSIIALKVEKRD